MNIIFFYYTRHIIRGKGEVSNITPFTQELPTPGYGKVNVFFFFFNTNELENGNHCSCLDQK